MEIRIECQGAANLPLESLEPVQGGLKQISNENYVKLKNEILTNGFSFPFFVWQNKGTNWILDGHHRRKVLLKMLEEGYKIPDLPCATVNARNMKEAAEKLLAVTSQYAKITKDGLEDFIEKYEIDFSLVQERFEFSDIDFSDFKVAGNESEGGSYADGEKGSMEKNYGAPPFSILDTKQGYWKDGRDRWNRLGIKSEVGREANLLAPEASIVSGINKGTSIFDPFLCEILYRWFSKKADYIIDPFAGGSVRGVVCSKLERFYFGVDLRQEQIDANILQSDICNDNYVPVWKCGDSINIKALAKDYKADFLFSCPPYADLEVYSDLDGDISNMEYADFLSAYTQIIKNCYDLLENNRFACFVIGEVRDSKGNYYNFVGDTIRAFIDAGFSYYNEIILANSAGTLPLRAGKVLKSSRKIGKMHQNVLVFVKGDGKEAAQRMGDVYIPEIKDCE